MNREDDRGVALQFRGDGCHRIESTGCGCQIQLNPAYLQEEIDECWDEKCSGGYPRPHTGQPPKEGQEAERSDPPPGKVRRKKPFVIAPCISGEGERSFKKGVMRAREARMSKSLVYCIITTGRESARRDSLMAAISPAPPGIVPRNAVAMSRRVWRVRIQPLRRLVRRMKTTAKTKIVKCLGNVSNVAGEKPAPKAVPMTVWPVR